jgi:hypothetical protein
MRQTSRSAAKRCGFEPASAARVFQTLLKQGFRPPALGSSSRSGARGLYVHRQETEGRSPKCAGGRDN